MSLKKPRRSVQDSIVTADLHLGDCRNPSPPVNPDSTIELEASNSPSSPSDSFVPNYLKIACLVLFSGALTAHYLAFFMPSKACSRHKLSPKHREISIIITRTSIPHRFFNMQIEGPRSLNDFLDLDVAGF